VRSTLALPSSTAESHGYRHRPGAAVLSSEREGWQATRRRSRPQPHHAAVAHGAAQRRSV